MCRRVDGKINIAKPHAYILKMRSETGSISTHIINGSKIRVNLVNTIAQQRAMERRLNGGLNGTELYSNRIVLLWIYTLSCNAMMCNCVFINKHDVYNCSQLGEAAQ